jgi:hypothetical protein
MTSKGEGAEAMRLSIVFALAQIACTLGVPRAALADPGCSSSESGVGAFYANLFEALEFGCSQDNLVSNLREGLENLDITWENDDILYHSVASNDPPRTTILVQTFEQHRTQIILTHADDFMNDLMMTEIFQSRGFREARKQEYLDAGYSTNELRTWDNQPQGYYSLGLTAAGIQNRLAPKRQAENLLLIMACNSNSLQGWFGGGFYPSTSGGATYVGFDTGIYMDAVCESLPTMIERLGCLWGFNAWPFHGHQIDDAVDGYPYVAIAGNQTNQFNCNRSCISWGPYFLEVYATNGAVHWAVFSEKEETYYVIRGWRSTTSEPDTLAFVPGRSGDGQGRIRVYSERVPPDYDRFDLIGVPPFGRERRSDAVTWGDKPYAWQALVDRDNKYMGVTPREESSAGHPVEWAAADSAPPEHGDSVLLPPGAHVVVYSSIEEFLAPVVAQVELTTAPDGFGTNARAFHGSTDPIDARIALQQTIDDNITFNEGCQQPGCRNYPTDPTLVVVGNKDIVSYMLYDDDIYGSCGTGGHHCASYGLIADLDGDGIQDCPVQVIPAEDLVDVMRSCQAGQEWNDGQWVDPLGSVGVFAGDVCEGGSGAWLVTELAQVSNTYQSWGSAFSGALRESEFPTADDAGLAGIDFINNGVRDLWLQGFQTNQHDYTNMLRPIPPQTSWDWANLLTKKQRMMVFAPSCLTANWGSVEPLHASLLFNDPERSMATGLVGVLNLEYGQDHQILRHTLLDKLEEHLGENIAYARIVHEAVLATAEVDPQYAKGIVFLGSYAMNAPRAVDLSQTSVCSYTGSSPDPCTDADLTVVACPGNNSSAHGDPALQEPSDFLIDVVLKDMNGDPVEGVSNLRLEFDGCTGPPGYRHEPLSGALPDTLEPDGATDADGVARFRSVLAFGGKEPCGYTLYVGDEAVPGLEPSWGVRSPDMTGDGLIALGDLFQWQDAYLACSELVQPPPVESCYLCDLNGDGLCALGDLQLWQLHFGHGSGDGPSGAAGSTSQEVEESPPTSGDSLDRTRLYLHITDRAPTGTPAPVVLPGQASPVVGPLGANGRDVTIWLYAVGYSELAGVHARFAWPNTWRLDGAEELLPGQVFGYEEVYSTANEAFMTAFNCLERGDPVAIGRFDVHVSSSGGVAFNAQNALLRVIDCHFNLTDLVPPGSGDSAPAGSPSALPTQTPSETTLTCLTPVANSVGGEFLLRLKEDAAVTSRVYDVTGRTVATVHMGASLAAGDHAVRWDGRNDRGVRAAAGVYFLEVKAGASHFTERIVLVH